MRPNRLVITTPTCPTASSPERTGPGGGPPAAAQNLRELGSPGVRETGELRKPAIGLSDIDDRAGVLTAARKPRGSGLVLERRRWGSAWRHGDRPGLRQHKNAHPRPGPKNRGVRPAGRPAPAPDRARDGRRRSMAAVAVRNMAGVTEPLAWTTLDPRRGSARNPPGSPGPQCHRAARGGTRPQPRLTRTQRTTHESIGIRR